MERHNLYRIIIGVVVWSLIGFAGQVGEATSHKVLVVMSYHETYPWGMAIKEGIEEVLPDSWTIKYVYLDTKRNMEGVKQKLRRPMLFTASFNRMASSQRMIMPNPCLWSHT